jgi:DivIVA domain-containing protein
VRRCSYGSGDEPIAEACAYACLLEPAGQARHQTSACAHPDDRRIRTTVCVPVTHTRVVAGNDVRPSRHGQPEEGLLTGMGFTDVRDPLPPEIRDPSFSTVVRGYDRHAVDRYVEEVNRVIAELQTSGSPRAAVRHALDRVGEQTSGILQRARETAEEIIASAREEAEETTRRAKAEAQDILDDARARASEIASRAETEAGTTIASAQARADELLAQATNEAQRTVAEARDDAQTRSERANEELTALHEQAEARMRALDEDIARVAESRRTLLAEANALAAGLAQLVADAEAHEPAGEMSTPAPDDAAGAPDGPAENHADR